MTLNLRAEIVQTVVLLNAQNQILILKTPHGKWQLPGGRLQENETWDDGLRREILEETGNASVEIISLLMVNNWVFESIPQFGVYFLCRTDESSIRLSHEHIDYRWASKDDDLAPYDFWHYTLRDLVERTFRQIG